MVVKDDVRDVRNASLVATRDATNASQMDAWEFV